MVVESGVVEIEQLRLKRKDVRPRRLNQLLISLFESHKRVVLQAAVSTSWALAQVLLIRSERRRHFLCAQDIDVEVLYTSY
jgi:hypothetical protein